MVQVCSPIELCMGWLANYRWLKSVANQELPPIDHAKAAATKAEREVAAALRSMPEVIQVHHARRLTKIEAGRSRREVDLIAVLNDRIVLIEIKLYKGSITMDDEGVLHQNGASRGWSFAKLDDATKRLTDTMGLTGIFLDQTEVHSVLLIQGDSDLDASVTTGSRLTRALVANDLQILQDYLRRPLSNDAAMDDKKLKAVKTFFAHCGTWDVLTLNNGVSYEGDMIDGMLVDEWRSRYRTMRWSNERGWWGTFFFGPRFRANVETWEAESTVLDADPSSNVTVLCPNGKTESHSLDHLRSLEFGYQSLPDWSALVLSQPKIEAIQEESLKAKHGLSDAPYHKGECINNVTVSGIHDEHGIFFTLDAKNSGLYRKRVMQEMEWTMREALYTVGNKMDVVVVGVKKKGKNGWNIEVKPIET